MASILSAEDAIGVIPDGATVAVGGGWDFLLGRTPCEGGNVAEAGGVGVLGEIPGGVRSRSEGRRPERSVSGALVIY